MMGASEWDTTPSGKFVEVENDHGAVALYRNGVKTWSWSKYGCSGENCYEPTDILEELGVDVERRYTHTKMDKYVWSFPSKLTDVVLSEERCSGCNEYVCRTCV